MRGAALLGLATALFCQLSSTLAQVGIVFDQELCDPSSGPCTSADESAVQEVAQRLEDDPQVKVLNVALGTLVCDDIDEAEGSSTLQFATSINEVLTAERTLFTVQDGSDLPDGLDRKTWHGRVVDPAPIEDVLATTVSMTWTSPCSPETFVFAANDPVTSEDGTRSVVKSVPCSAGTDTTMCVVEMALDLKEEVEPLELSVDEEADDARKKARLLRVHEDSEAEQELARDHDGSGGSRRLVDSTQVDMLVLYSSEVVGYLGSEAATLSELSSRFTETAAAMGNSEIAMDLNVQFAELPFSITTTDMGTLLGTVRTNAAVQALRDQYHADFVQAVVYFAGSPYCGIGYLPRGSANYAYSVAGINCMWQYTQTHELGHNLDAYHNRENSSTKTTYSHGWRNCVSQAQGGFRTIMSYGCPGLYVPRINFFSNPNIYFAESGQYAGTSTDNNARTISESMVWSANYRTAPAPPTPAPTTPAPTTSAPTTPAPTTPAPTTPAPTTPAPTTPAPTTPAPTTPAPTTPAPTTPAPTPAPTMPPAHTTPAPTTPAPTTPAPTPATTINPCLDPNSSAYRCNSGQTINLNGCGLVDGDAEDARACILTSAKKAKRVKKIKMRFNKFTTLPTSFLSGMKKLKVLDLRNNCKLQCVPEGGRSNRKVKTSGCNRNALKTSC